MRRVAWAVVGLIGSGCAARTPAGPAFVGSAHRELVPNAAAASAVDDGAALIDALRELDRDDATPVALDAFIRANPEILRARVKPYGSALAWVLEYAHEEAALALLRAGARADEPLLGDGRMLALSAGRGLDRVVTMLLAGGTPVDEATYWGTALHAAAGQGDTPLHEAARYAAPRPIEALLARGARRDLKNHEGRTPRDLALARGERALAEKLR